MQLPPTSRLHQFDDPRSSLTPLPYGYGMSERLQLFLLRLKLSLLLRLHVTVRDVVLVFQKYGTRIEKLTIYTTMTDYTSAKIFRDHR